MDEVKCEIQSEEEETYTFWSQPNIKIEDVFVDFEDSHIKQEIICKMEVDDKQDNNSTGIIEETEVVFVNVEDYFVKEENTWEREEEREERERKRQKSEIRQIKFRTFKEKMQQISQTSHGQKVLKKLDEDEIKKINAEQIAAREAEELQKEANLKSQEQKVDYFERAKRLEEIPLRRKLMEEKQVQDQKIWEQQEAERIALAVEERTLAVANRERLIRMKTEKDAFLEKLKSERRRMCFTNQ